MRGYGIKGVVGSAGLGARKERTLWRMIREVISLDTRKRLTRKPFTTLIWLVFVTLMTGFLAAATALWYSTAKLADTLDKNHTAIAVRSDPGVVKRSYSVGSVTWEIQGRTFTEQDAEAIEAMPGVKAVRSHTFAGGTSSAFHPFLDVQRQLSWNARGNTEPYHDAVFAGKLAAVRNSEYSYYSGYMDGYLEMLFELEDILLLNDEYEEPAENMRYMRGFTYRINIAEDPELASYFVEGEHYILSGIFLPNSPVWDWNVYLNPELAEKTSRRQQATYFTLDGGDAIRGDGYLESHLDGDMTWDPETQEIVYRGTIPAVERYDGDPKTFFDETPHDAWRSYRDLWLKQNHALSVIGTDRLETIFSFQSGDAIIIDGRSFTDEEYETGARVMVISETTAEHSGLSVGDTIPFSQFRVDNEKNFDLGRRMNNPDVGLMRTDMEYTDEEPFTIVGIYRLQALWSNGTYTFTPNTVFIPRGAQIDGAFGTIKPWIPPTSYHIDDQVFSAGSDGELIDSEGNGLFEESGYTAESSEAAEPGEKIVITGGDFVRDENQDVYGLYITVELENGSIDEFELALEQSPYAGQFFAYDQGFEVVQRDLNGLSTSTARLSWIAFGGWVLLLLLYLLMYQSAQKRNVGVMRSLGAEPKTAVGYLVCSGMITAILGILIGTAVSRVILGFVQSHVLSDMLGAIDRTAYGGALVIPEETLREMVNLSTPHVGAMLLFALVQICILGAAVWVHAAILSNRNPRKLLEG